MIVIFVISPSSRLANVANRLIFVVKIVGALLIHESKAVNMLTLLVCYVCCDWSIFIKIESIVGSLGSIHVLVNYLQEVWYTTTFNTIKLSIAIHN